MAAGQGFKTFTTGEVLTATDVNGYLMQGVLVFASAAARNAAITSPQEGQFAFTKDVNGLWYYDGAAWVSSGATGDIEGVTAGTGISGGGTSGTVTVTNSMATAIDAKGDLVVGTGADAFSRLAVGTNTYLLTADSAEATGLKWAAPASSGGMTLINTGGTALTGASISVGSIPSTYQSLYISVVNFKPATMNAYLNVRMNGDSGANRHYYATTNVAQGSFNQTRLAISYGQNSGGTYANIIAQIPNYADGTIWKSLTAYSLEQDATTITNFDLYSWYGAYNQITAISSLDFFCNTGNFTSGTVYVYGVK